MNIDKMTRDELVELVKQYCVQCKRKTHSFVANEWYQVIDQNDTHVTVVFDDRVYPFTYEEMEEYFYSMDEQED